MTKASRKTKSKSKSGLYPKSPTPCPHCQTPTHLPTCPHCQTPAPATSRPAVQLRICPDCGESRPGSAFRGKHGVIHDTCRNCRRPRLDRDGLNGYGPARARRFVLPPGCEVAEDVPAPNCPAGEGVAVLTDERGLPVVKPAVVYRILDRDERGRVFVRNEISNLRAGEVCFVLR